MTSLHKRRFYPLVFLSLSFAAGLGLRCMAAPELRVTSLTPSGQIHVKNTFSNGVVTIERATGVGNPWVPERSVFTPGLSAQVDVSLTGASGLFRARATDLWAVSGPWTLRADDLLDLPALAARLGFPQDSDTVAQYLGGVLSAETLGLLSDYVGGEDTGLRKALVADLNRVIQGFSIYDPDLFAAVALSPSTQTLLDSFPQGDKVQQLNRFLLEDAFASELLQKRAAGFTNFVHSFGLLTTIAGSGQIACVSCNSWNPEAEGGQATNAPLSSPHIAMADRAGNIYIADKRAHAIRKVSPDGTLTTVAGNGQGGLGDTTPGPAIEQSLNNPNGLWVREDGTFYILDRDNGLIRKVDTNGIMSVLADNGTPISGGRGLWVSPDESILYFCAGNRVKSWDTTNGLSTYSSGFADLANMAIDPHGNIVVADAGHSHVVRIEPDGSQTVIAGAVTGMGLSGDGQLAIQTRMEQARGVWFLPTGAFFVTTDSTSQVWYVDPDGHAHLLLDGDAAGAHAGDGEWFYNDLATHKVSNVRQITLDYAGNLIIAESNLGYIRKIRFLPFGP